MGPPRQVYHGRCRGQPVAVKVLACQPAPLAAQGGAGGAAAAADAAEAAAVAAAAPVPARLLDEFRREASTMLRLPPHPHVLRLVAVTARPPLAICTELCARGSLYALLHDPRAALTWATVARLLREAAEGMRFLHAQGVLHR